MKLTLLVLLFSTSVLANLKHAPPSFDSGERRAVFVDFKHAQYDIVYDAFAGKAEVVSTINFDMPEKGYPLFDSVSKPTFLSIDGHEVKQRMISVPGKVSVMRLVGAELSIGNYTLKIKSPIENGTRFKQKRRNWHSVSSGFFIRDLKGRKFLERYLPTNYEYDQYKMEMDVRVVGTKRWHSLFANGKTTKVKENHYKVSMPKWYSTSSVFFHLVPVNRFVRWYLTYPSIDGRDVPVTIYSSYNFYNNYAKAKAWRVLKELEADYGPYPHDQLIIYGTGIKGGMEHAGAMETSIVSLGHEMQHMWFAKGIHPANGNSGWLDEGIASWRDKGHQANEKPSFEGSNIGNHSVYTRRTDKRSYAYGRSFLSYINYQLQEIGKPGLKDFLRTYVKKRMHTNIVTEDFISDLQDYANMSFADDFRKYILGEVNNSKKHGHKDLKENPHHPNLTQEELDSII